jgi:hypothetical protein
MGFFAAIVVWLIMAAVLAAGIVMAVKGSVWLLIVGFVLFVLGFAKIGCLSH